MNGDGMDEIYACHRNYCMLRQLDYQTGETLDSLLVERDGSDFNAMGMSAVDIDHDEKPELIIYGYFLDFGYWIYAIDEGLNIIEGWPHDMWIDNFVVPSSPVFGDIDNDGELEYLTSFFDISAGYVVAYNIDGSPYFPGTNGLFVTTPEPSVLNMLLLADMNGDESTDIIVCANNDMFNTYEAQRIYVWDNDGKLLPGFPLITSENPFTNLRFTPSVGDITGNGNVGLIMTTPDSAGIFVDYPAFNYNEGKSPAPFWRYNRRMNNTAFMGEDSIPTDITEGSNYTIPRGYHLGQNHPNPFNPYTTLSYEIPSRAWVTLTVYDILGRELVTLVDGFKSAGRYSITWDGSNREGNRVSSGVYFYRLKADDFVEARKMIFLK